MEKPREVAVAVTYNSQMQKFLVLRRADSRDRFPGKWEFVSGFIEENESVPDAALRELREETGLVGEVIREGESFVIESESLRINPVLVVVDGEGVELSEEHTEYRWVDTGELEDLEAVPKLEKDLKSAGVEL